MKKTFPFVRQLDAMDCGVACLAMICRHYGRYYRVEYLRELCFTTRDGVSMLNLRTTAENLGFRSIGIRIDIEQLIEDAVLPCIVHWKQNHFIVVYRIKARKKTDNTYEGTVYVADPAYGLAQLPIENFLAAWVSTQQAGIGKGIALLLEPTPAFFEKEEKRQHYRTLPSILKYLNPYRRYVIQLFLGVILGSTLQLIFPFLTQSIVDYGIGNQDLSFVGLVLIAQLVLFLSQTMVEFIQSWILLHITTRINVAMISDFLIKLMRLPIRFFDTKLIGDLLQRIKDNSRIQNFLTNEILQSFFSGISLIVFLTVLAIYNIGIFLVFFLASILYVLWILLFLKKRRELDYKRFSQSAAEQSNLYEMVTSMQEIKLQNCEHHKRWAWENIQAKLFKVNLQGLALSQYQQAGGAFINQLKNILISFLSARAVIKGEMTLGMMMAVQYIVGQLNAPVSLLIGFIRSAQDAKISLERLSEIQQKGDEEDENKGRLSNLPKAADLCLQNVGFRYGGPDSPTVLEDITLTIPHGKITAIVGMSGSGKTTLIKLLLGFYTPVEGSIQVDSYDLSRINTHFWRSRCGAVMQDGIIFSDTIAHNIAVGVDTIDTERLRFAARIACIEEMVDALPLGYNTKIGQEGNGLSQGQKQRILIARTVYKNPDYLFFDEATNSLDANNERAIMGSLENFFLGKTVIIVAHRLSTVKHADQIVVLEKGRVKEQGTHKELINRKGIYYELVKNQLELGN